MKLKSTRATGRYVIIPLFLESKLMEVIVSASYYHDSVLIFLYKGLLSILFDIRDIVYNTLSDQIKLHPDYNIEMIG